MNKAFQPLELFIGLRYTRARRKGQFVSFISLASMIGIAIGVLVLITVLSVMNGFEQAMRDRMLGMVAHVTVSEAGARIDQWPERREAVMQVPNVAAVSPFIEQAVMISQGDEARGVLLQAIEPGLESQAATVFEHVVEGDMHALTPGSYGIAIGKPLAEDLQVGIGDSLTLISPSADILTSNEIPLLKRFNIKAIFHIDMQSYDEGFAYINIEDAAETLDYGDRVTGLRLRLDNAYQARTVSDDIINRFSPDWPNLWVSDWTFQHSNYFRAIQVQKSVMFIILLMIIAVAAFNLVSTLVMVVTDKESDIAILRTLGLSPAGIMRIFMVQGTLIGVIGTLLGVVLGLLLASQLETLVPLLERLFDTNFISPDVYFISQLESEIDWSDVFLIAVSSLLMSIIATLYPAWRAAKLQPAEALRYE